MVRQFYKIAAFLAVAVCFPAGGYGQDYTLSMLPRYSTEEISKRINGLAAYLSEATGLTIRPRLTVTFDDYLKQLNKGAIDIGFQNPYIYVLAAEAHEVIAMVDKGRDGDKFRGIIITAAGSPIKRIEDLRGKTIGIVSYTSAGGYLSQKLTLEEHDLDVARDCTIEVAPENKQENVMFAVFTGDVDAGFIRESALEQVQGMIPQGAIEVMVGTAWLPNWALSVNRNMALADREKILAAIEAIPADSPVLETMKIRAMRRAIDSEYDSVRRAAGLPES